MIAALEFARPPELQATAPPETRGLGRDDVRMLVTGATGHRVERFADLESELHAGDLLVVNDSATLPASLPARGHAGRFLVNLSTDYGRGRWLVEPRWSTSRPGPVPLADGERFEVGGLGARTLAPYPGLPRLLFVHLEGDPGPAMRRFGRPIRYGYVPGEYPLAAYQTVFARVPGSAEMPSAGRPFTSSLLARLGRAGVRTATITLHAGVSSLESDPGPAAALPTYPEPFEVPPVTVAAIAATRRRGGRVLAVGTTVVRALETAAEDGGLRPMRGFTRALVHPGRPPAVVDGLLTGLHDPRTTHLAMLVAFAGLPRIAAAYRRAVEAGLLWHEFGDVHLIVPDAAT